MKYLRFNFFILLFLISILFTACTNSQEKIEVKNTYPSWYLNPISKDNIYFYGIGEAENLDKASKNALKNLSSSIFVKLQTSETLKKESILKYREYVFKEYSQNINSQTENLTFQNYEIINSKKHRYNNFIVQVRVKKQDLINSLKYDLNSIYKKYENFNLVKTLSKDPLTKYLTLKEIQTLFIQSINKTKILKSIDSKFNNKDFDEKLNTISAKLEDLRNSISFSLDNNINNNIVNDKIKEYLYSKGFKVKNNSNYKIKILSKINYKNPRGFYLVNLDLNISIYYLNKKVLTNTYTINGNSSNSFEDSIYDAYSQLKLNFLD